MGAEQPKQLSTGKVESPLPPGLLLLAGIEGETGCVYRDPDGRLVTAAHPLFNRHVVEVLPPDSLFVPNGGVPKAFGQEIEGVMMRDGAPDVSFHGLELSESQIEIAAGAVQNLPALLDQRKALVRDHPELLVCSMPLTGDPREIGLTQHPDIVGYVGQIQGFLFDRMLEAWQLGMIEPVALSGWQQVSQYFGYGEDPFAIFRSTETVAPCLWNASHVAFDLPQQKTDGGMAVSYIHAINVADLIVSQLGLVANMLMANGPCVYGREITDSQGNQVRDVRYALNSVWPTTGSTTGPILSPDTYISRLFRGIVNGDSHTADRCGYRTSVGALMHGLVRNRLAVSPDKVDRSDHARIEATGPSATPDMRSFMEGVAFNTILYMFGTMATERGISAPAFMARHGIRAASLYETRRPQGDFNVRRHTPEVRRLFADAVRVVKLAEDIPGMPEYVVELAQRGVARFYEPPSASIQEYQRTDSGLFADAMAGSLAKGDPLRLTEGVLDYQQWQAHQ